MSYHYHVFCCINERPKGHKRGCCLEKDALTLRNYMKARVKELHIPDSRINTAGCLDRCEEGPVMVIYPEGIWYQVKSTQHIDRIITEHLQQGNIVESLRLRDA